MNKINVCLTCDNNYICYAGVTIASILQNADVDDNLHFYIITNDTSEENKKRIINLKKIKNFEIDFISPDIEQFKDYENVTTIEYLPIASFYRLNLAELIPNIDKVIYLDSDIVVNTTLSSLFNININNYYCGGVVDIAHKKLAERINLKQGEFYINSGVLLLNLKKCRQDNMEKIILQYAKEHINEINLGDQDLINKCFAGKILKLDIKWNFQVVNFCYRSSFANDFNILHYTGSAKPWKFGSYMPFKEHYFKYAAMTDWNIPTKIERIKSDIFSIFLFFKDKPFFLFTKDFYKAIYRFVKKI